jgi:serralysin
MAYVHGNNEDNHIDRRSGVTDNADTIYGYDGNDIIFGFGGDDLVFGGEGVDHVFGGSGNDSLKGGGADDRLRGNSGNDMLKGGGGADHLDGGEDIDTASYFDSPEGVVVSLRDDAAFLGHAEGDVLDNIENLIGSGHMDLLVGNDLSNELSGRDGHDSLKGWGGNDTLRGGPGDDNLDGGAHADTMAGGEGNDFYHVDLWWDSVSELGGEGMDEVLTSVSWTLTPGADVETLRTTDGAGLSPINLTGNASGNIIFGNNGDNVINGGDGRDQLTGFAGRDRFLFDTPLGSGNIDEVTDFVAPLDTIVLDQTIFSSLGLGTLPAGRLAIDPDALDADDRIIYRSGSGNLLYDSDGDGPSDSVLFATVSPGLALTNLDFFIAA